MWRINWFFILIFISHSYSQEVTLSIEEEEAVIQEFVSKILKSKTSGKGVSQYLNDFKMKVKNLDNTKRLGFPSLLTSSITNFEIIPWNEFDQNSCELYLADLRLSAGPKKNIYSEQTINPLLWDVFKVLAHACNRKEFLDPYDDTSR